MNLVFRFLGVFVGEGKVIQRFELLGDTAPFQQDCLPCHFSGMCREHRCDLYLLEGVEGALRREAGILHTEQRAAKRPGERGILAVQFARATAAFAVVGLRQIGQLEIDGERFGHAVGRGQVHLRDDLLRLLHLFRRTGLLRAAAHSFAMFNQQPA